MPDDDAIGWNVLGHHATGADNGVFADRDVGQDGAPGADRSPFLHQRPLDLPVGFGLELAAGRGGARVGVVDEGHIVADEHVVFDIDTFAHEGVARNLAVLSDSRVLLDLYERADFRLVADFATIQIDELRKLHIVSESYARRDAQIIVHTVISFAP